MERKIKIGIVGIANHGVTIRNAFLATRKFSIVSCYDINREELQKFTTGENCKAANSYDEILEDSSIEAVVLVTPNHQHLEQGLKAIKRKKHIFMEKPITNYVKEAVELIEAAREGNIILQVGHNMRKRIHFKEAKRLIDQRVIGDVVSFYANFSHDGGFNPNMPKWKSDSETCPLLPMMQLGIHFIDSIQYLVDDVSKVQCFASSFAMKDVLDSSVANIELKNGVIGSLQSHYVIPETFEYKIFGTKGTIYIRGNELYIEKIIDKKPVIDKQIFDETRNNSYVIQVHEFADCILNNKQPEVDGNVGLKALAVIEAMILSHKEKRIVEIKEIIP